ncbi:unnamed protein product [Moneuplotes crassus]|uniref:Uncharacterized protein n=2 Tax=Euplotes crassus TaxID=5936 RepID=A0AAD1Y0J4_EUPCR|nr:unnamed protein product [Moneuplotes crassus]
MQGSLGGGHYTAKTLNGNWYEDRWDHKETMLKSALDNTYTTTTGEIGKECKPVKEDHKEEFFNCTGNWMSFQPGFDGTFKTTQRVDYCSPSDQETKFKMKETVLTKDPEALERYRKKYTKAGHNFNRTYLGDEKGLKDY